VRFDWRLALSVPLLAAAAWFTWSTIEQLRARRLERTDLAEISHARYGLLNASVWIAKITPILDAQIDTLDLKSANGASMRPMVRNALNRLLDDVKAKMSEKPKEGAPAQPSLFGAGNAMIANMVIGALRPHVPEYADIVLAEIGRPETRDAVKKYVRAALVDAAKRTFGEVDMRVYSAILKEYGCADAVACQQELGRRIHAADQRIAQTTWSALGACALAFLLLLTGSGGWRRTRVVALLLFTVVLLGGGILTPMLEVEAKITHLKMVFIGTPIEFSDQVLYYQSKSVLEVFRALMDTNRQEMWAVGVLVLMFSVIFPIIKLLTSTLALRFPALLRNPVAAFFALKSSKWSMADVMALAIFMSFVAFNGLIPNTMKGLLATGAEIAIPTDSSKILPGYYLFIGFCLASLFVSQRIGALLHDDAVQLHEAGRARTADGLAREEDR
jgi:hypothetical protein